MRASGTTLAYGAALLLAAGSFAVGRVEVSHLLSHARQRDHVHAVVSEARVVRASMSEAETAGRGYAVTGDRAFLAPFRAATRAVPERLGALLGLVDGEAEQVARVEAARSRCEARLDAIGKAIDARSRGGEGDWSVASAALGDGSDARDVQARFEAVEAAEGRELAEAEEGLESSRTALDVTLLAGTAASAVLLVGVFLRLRREIRVRRDAQTAAARFADEVGGLADGLARKNAELEAVNAELEAFSYSVSHDLRAPLRSIDGFSAALLEDCGERLDERGRDHLRRVRAASARMATLIDDLLGLARVAKTEIRREPVDLSAVAREVLEGLRARDAGRRVEAVVAEGCVAQGDPRLLRLVLQNLLENAWKFTSKKDAARIEFGGERAADGAVAWFVRDDGAGFDMAHADRLFGTFQRLHSADEFPGTGVGLATVRRIVGRHGGRVLAEGAPGAGATFRFTL